MIGVDLGNEQRHVGHHPVVPRVAHDDVARFGECAFDLCRDRRIEPGEHQLRCVARRRSLDDPPRDVVGKAIGKPPGGGVAERFAFRALAGAEPLHLEPGMVREKGDELLADHAGRAENADGYRCHDRDSNPVGPACLGAEAARSGRPGTQKKSRRG